MMKRMQIEMAEEAHFSRNMNVAEVRRQYAGLITTPIEESRWIRFWAWLMADVQIF